MDYAKLNPWNWFKREDEQEQSPSLPTRQAGPAPAGRSMALKTPLADLHSEVNRIFDRAFQGFGFPAPTGEERLPSFERLENAVLKPRVDISGSEEEYAVAVELPGVEEKDISVELKGDTLIIRAEKKREEKTEDKGWYRVERSYGAFQRVLSVPEDADVDGVKAKYDNGVLNISLPRKHTVESAAARKIAIE